MHGFINKAYMEKLKALIIKEGIYTNVRVTTAAQKYQPMENDNFLPTTNIKKIKDTYKTLQSIVSVQTCFLIE